MTTHAYSNLIVFFLGECALSLDQGIRKAPRPKESELLFLLLSAQGNPCSRQELALKLWPTADHENATANLRQLLYRLRELLDVQAHRLNSEEQKVWFDMAQVEVDVFLFRDAVNRLVENSDPAERQHALDRYTGPLLPGSKSQHIVEERQRLQNLYLHGLEELANRLMLREQHEEAATVLWRGLNTDPTRESTVSLLLYLYAQDAARAEKVFATYLRAIGKDFQREPDARILAEINKIRQAQRPRKVSKKSGRPPVVPRLDRFPLALHPLIGRSEETETIRLRLAQSPLVSLIGPGGVGKTRLALEICRQDQNRYPDGVVFVDLAGLPPEASQERVAEAVTATLEVKGGADLFLSEVAGFLATRHMLVVLDNCEHVPIACLGVVRNLLQRCPRLTLLVTSRVELTTNFGITVRIEPLPVPTASAPADVETLQNSPAVQLFLSAVQNRDQGFRLTAENAREIARICCATDGLPLAIHLVASKSLTTTELAEVLSGGFASVHLAEDPTVPERARTVMSSVAWSVRLLTERQRQLLYGLSIFTDGWTQEATERLFGTPDSLSTQAIPLLEQLRTASLVEQRVVAGRSRYHMLETIREYALLHFHKTTAYDTVAQRHLDYYLELAEATEALPPGKALNAALLSLSWDQENLRTALDYSLATGKTEKTLRMVAALARYWYMQGRNQEGRHYLDRILAIGREAPLELRRNTLHSAAAMAYIRNDYERAEKLWTECLTLSLEIGDENWILRTQGNLGNVMSDLENYREARLLFETARAGFRRLGNEPGEAVSLGNLAWVSSREGKYAEALRLYEASLDMFRAQENAYHITLGLNNMAYMLIAQGEFDNAHNALAEAIQVALEHSNRDGIGHCLTNYVMLAVARGDMKRAAFLMGADEALRAEIEYPIPLKGQIDFQRARQQAVADLGDKTFGMLWNAGKRPSLPEICRYAKDKHYQLV